MGSTILNQPQAQKTENWYTYHESVLSQVVILFFPVENVFDGFCPIVGSWKCSEHAEGRAG